MSLRFEAPGSIEIRGHGHSEIDDPTITQPLLYYKIISHPPLWKLYAEKLDEDPEPIVQMARYEYEKAQVAGRALTENPQLIIDQFITAGEDKWGLLSGLVMLLPHGYEGQGPEHSSGRIERFLQLGAEDNNQVCQPSTSAQYFHLLRRQAVLSWRKPLVVFTPKSMLRSPDASSVLDDFCRPRFIPVLSDAKVEDPERVLICSGKIGHELKAERTYRNDARTAIVFLEQMYPFPEEALATHLRCYGRAREIVWVQEEPANMGALTYILLNIEKAAGGLPVRSVKRSVSASPATGSARAHEIEQRALLALAFDTGIS